MQQTAPDPEELFELVALVRYRPGWIFELQDLQRDDDHGRGIAGGLTLVITTLTPNSYRPHACETCRSVVTDYQVLKIEQHEACEFFRLCPSPRRIHEIFHVHDDERPYAPVHAPGHDPYTIRELTTDEARRTSFRGVVESVD